VKKKEEEIQLSSDSTALIGVGVSATQRLAHCNEALRQQQVSRLCTSRYVELAA